MSAACDANGADKQDHNGSKTRKEEVGAIHDSPLQEYLRGERN